LRGKGEKRIRDVRAEGGNKSGEVRNFLLIYISGNQQGAGYQ
jgi:hypothetical protein